MLMYSSGHIQRSGYIAATTTTTSSSISTTSVAALVPRVGRAVSSAYGRPLTVIKPRLKLLAEPHALLACYTHTTLSVRVGLAVAAAAASTPLHA